VSTPSTLTIGEVARRAGVNPSAIRFYESHNVLPNPRRENGQRRYGPDTITRLEMIDTCKRAGFALDEIAELLRAADEGHPTHEKLQQLAHAKLPEIDALARRVRGMQTWLKSASNCDCATLESCELFAPDILTPAPTRSRRSPDKP
jgi:MerR family transcriptional regulator, redox-sensitive transcriptional activator SoxR